MGFLESLIKALWAYLGSESVKRIFLDIAADLAAQTDNTVDDQLVLELRKRLLVKIQEPSSSQSQGRSPQ